MIPTAGTVAPRAEEAERTLKWVRGRRDEFSEFVAALARLESPSDDPASQRPVQSLLAAELEGLGFRVGVKKGSRSGGLLYARPPGRVRRRQAQLLVGHCDTVWPIGTLERMPVVIEDDVVRGPGTLDMKGGLAQIVFALRALRELDRKPDLAPLILVNSDEEIGSPDSKPFIERLARRVERAYVLEPALGVEGRIKTARKGLGRYEVRVEGRAAHAGLEPERGASAILELAHVIEAMHALNDPAAGVSVNVGVIDGGLRANVVAPTARAVVDVRVRTAADAARVDEAIHSFEPATEGVVLHVTGGMGKAPMERTPRNRALWRLASAAGRELDLPLEEAFAGGGSDGNTISQHAATLDGLGSVGDGAHALHEHIRIDASLERCALLARLLLMRGEP